MSHGMREFLPWRTLDTDGFVKLIQNIPDIQIMQKSLHIIQIPKSKESIEKKTDQEYKKLRFVHQIT